MYRSGGILAAVKAERHDTKPNVKVFCSEEEKAAVFMCVSLELINAAMN